MWHVADIGDIIMHAIFGDCRLSGMVRGVILLYSVDLKYRPYNSGHTAVLLCDRFLTNNLIMSLSSLKCCLTGDEQNAIKCRVHKPKPQFLR